MTRSALYWMPGKPDLIFIMCLCDLLSPTGVSGITILSYPTRFYEAFINKDGLHLVYQEFVIGWLTMIPVDKCSKGGTSKIFFFSTVSPNYTGASKTFLTFFVLFPYITPLFYTIPILWNWKSKRPDLWSLYLQCCLPYRIAQPTLSSFTLSSTFIL